MSWSSKHIWNTSINERQLQCTSSDWDYKAKWALCAQRRFKSYRAQPNRCFLLILCPCGCTWTCLPMSAVQCVEVCEHLCLWVYSSPTIIIWIYQNYPVRIYMIDQRVKPSLLYPSSPSLHSTEYLSTTEEKKSFVCRVWSLSFFYSIFLHLAFQLFWFHSTVNQ